MNPDAILRPATRTMTRSPSDTAPA
jgi:hypothetical protein